MGKFAEENGIDIKKYTKELPENNKYDFSQKKRSIGIWESNLPGN